MRVDELCQILRRRMSVRQEGPASSELAGVAYHSARTGPGFLFAALPGAGDDGARHVPEALARGAIAVLCAVPALEKMPPRPENVAYLGADDVRLALGLAADAFWGSPSRELTMVGLTGTNGKTTLSYLMESMAREAGMPCGVIGTIVYRLGAETRAAERTTPEAPDLQEILRWMAGRGARMAVMEVSSHALAQKRVDGTHFDFAVFTNLSQDHLDFHGDMENYYLSKKRLFTDFDLKAAIINLDDPWGRRLASEVHGEIITFGQQTECLIRPREVHMSPVGLRMDLVVPGGLLPLSSPLIGRHNVQNVLAAAAVGWRLGLAAEAIAAGIAAMRDVPGRFQKVSLPGDPLVVVDYAHTPDALAKVLDVARQLVKGRVLLVFGCGGDRDRGKRPLMGELAAKGADLTIVTSDNPRSESPEEIIQAIVDGYRKARPDGLEVVPDRREAIRLALAGAGEEDIVLIAGKGHEDYQLVGQRKLHFDDREVAREALQAWRRTKR